MKFAYFVLGAFFGAAMMYMTYDFVNPLPKQTFESSIDTGPGSVIDTGTDGTTQAFEPTGDGTTAPIPTGGTTVGNAGGGQTVGN